MHAALYPSLHPSRASPEPAATPLPPPLTPPTPPVQYNLAFYLDYLARWPEYCQMAVGPGGQAMGYSERRRCRLLPLGMSRGLAAAGPVAGGTVMQERASLGPWCRPASQAAQACTAHARLTPAAHPPAVFGKVEGTGDKWHGHVTAVTVAPPYRRLRLAEQLMGLLEDVTDKQHRAFFVDLFVRVSNAVAIAMYTKARLFGRGWEGGVDAEEGGEGEGRCGAEGRARGGR